jgi:hypothetical protein
MNKEMRDPTIDELDAVNDPWWPYIVQAIILAAVCAAIPFWPRRLALEHAELAAMVIFPSVAVAYAVVMRGGPSTIPRSKALQRPSPHA